MKKLSDTYADELGTTVRLHYTKKGRVYLQALVVDEKQFAEGHVKLSRQEVDDFIAILTEAKKLRAAKKGKGA